VSAAPRLVSALFHRRKLPPPAASESEPEA
jgi:hypothetical protein